MQDQKSFKNELQHIIGSDEFDGEENLIKTAQAYLRNNTAASSVGSPAEPDRAEEERVLADFANSKHCGAIFIYTW